MRRTGYTTGMLRTCLGLIPELSLDFPVMIRTHTSQYSFDLAMQFKEMVRLQLGSRYKISLDKRGSSTWVTINDHARFQFVAYDISDSVGRAVMYREIFDDNSVFSIDSLHDYD